MVNFACEIQSLRDEALFTFGAVGTATLLYRVAGIDTIQKTTICETYLVNFQLYP